MAERILILTTADSGGAGLYNLELVKSLRTNGFEAFLLVQKKRSNYSWVLQVTQTSLQKIGNKLAAFFPYSLERDRLKIAKQHNKDFYFLGGHETQDFVTAKQIMQILPFRPDVIIACWTSRFVNFKQLGKLSAALHARAYVYTADMSPFTGGCHYAWHCEGYKSSCENCLALPPSLKKIAEENLSIKQVYRQKYNINAIAFSPFSQQQIRSSSLFADQKVVPWFKGYINEEIFNKLCRQEVRSKYGVPTNKKVIMLGALNLFEKRKGFQQLIESLQHLEATYPAIAQSLHLVAVGKQTTIDVSIGVNFLPFTSNENILSQYYQLSDIYASPSLEDTGPQMLIQAMACGAIPIAFNTGFGSELKCGVTGYVVPVGDIVAFAEAIRTVALLPQLKIDEIQRNIASKIAIENSVATMVRVFSQL